MYQQPKCFVPSCKNIVGVLFPKNPDGKKKWLSSLGLAHLNLKVDSRSFVCLDHFDKDGEPGGIPKEAISKTPPPAENNISVKQHRYSTRSSSSHQDVAKKTVEIDQNFLSKVRERYKKVSSIKENENKVDSVQDEQVMPTAYDTTCRLCMTHSSTAMENVYNKIDGKHTIAHMITVCLHPLQISPSDKLSKNICINCLQSLKEHFKFHQMCLEMDEKQRELVAIDQQDPNEGHEDFFTDTDDSDEYLHEERLSDYENNKENKDSSKSGINESESTTHNINNKKSEIDSRFDNVEAQLARVLGDEITIEPKKIQSKDSAPNSSRNKNKYLKGKDDEDYTENIIIEMVNDEEPQTPIIPKLPITIKRISSDRRKAVKRKKSFNDLDDNITMIKGGNNEELVVLPKGIKVEIKEKYASSFGSFSCQPIKYLFDHEYLLADGYLYENWLTKYDIRNLRCIVPKCPGKATQERLGSRTFANNIKVIVPHDHRAPDQPERKRQMFYNIMYGKMRKDKNFNFKLLYERFCMLDPQLNETLPLRRVISEICRQGPIVQPPFSNSFEDFYNCVEDDELHKIRFTDNQVQFYQDRFQADDGSKAVVFANPDTIDLYSHSKLMYVDASFYIDLNAFPFKLVTVLVWVYESYYPILYAFVNKKSQKIYRKIFDFLHNSLAPKLRPEEIITDYEANLYYALGETYVESSIGGSMFYFAQNLYKKICSLNLAKELDVDSNFRSIYNMLLMLPLLPVNTILDGLHNVEVQAKELGVDDLTKELFAHVQNEWIDRVTPGFFCVHRLENRINENIVAPFKKFRDFLMVSRIKAQKNQSVTSIVQIVEKILELDKLLRDIYKGPGRRTFAKDLSSSQKKIVLKAWTFIENHPKININHFFLKVLGYIKCLENQLWIWGFYRYEGDNNDELINANNFSIINEESQEEEHLEQEDISIQVKKEEITEALEEEEDAIEEFYIEDGGSARRVRYSTTASLLEDFSDEIQNDQNKETEQLPEKQATVLMEAVLDENGSFVLQNKTNTKNGSMDSNFFVYT